MLTNDQIGKIIVTQESLRSIENLIIFRDMKLKGKIFDDVRLTRLIEYPDYLFAHDGHTRLTGAYISGLHLIDEEYRIESYSIKEYMQCNFPKKYVTPFNPLTEVRLRDFFFVKQFFINNNFSEEQILENKHLYCKIRSGNIDTIKQLAERYTKCLKSV